MAATAVVNLQARRSRPEAPPTLMDTRRGNVPTRTANAGCPQPGHRITSVSDFTIQWEEAVVSTKLNRRQILISSAVALSGAYCGRSEQADETAAPAPVPAERSSGGPLTIKKSLKFGMFREEGLSIQEKFEILKEVGFDGVELDSPADLDRDEVIAARDGTGLEIPGVISSLHWKKPLSDPDTAVRNEGRSGLEGALRDAALYGATTVLLVPAVVNKEVQYDQAWARSQAEIRKAVPVAREVGVKIAIENVWNSFLFSPLEMARYIDELNDPLVGAYFDVGNVVNFGWPEQWIRILGSRIMKLDIKEYSREKRAQEGPYAGFRVPLGEGDCDWPAVVSALEETGYSGGWGSAEVKGGDRERLKEISERMDRILPTLH